MRILLIEDEPNIVEALRFILNRDGWAVDTHSDGKTAMQAVENRVPDLIILDVMLPGVDGLEVLRRLRGRHEIPVLMLTARNTETDKVLGFEIGADDYLTKPFDLDILEARMMALIRRYRGTVASSKLEYGEVSIDQKTRKAYRQDKLLALNPTTYTILEMLVKSAPDVVTREEIAFQLWQENEPNNDVLRSHIYQLRNQLDKPFEQHVLITVPKVGFRLETGA